MSEVKIKPFKKVMVANRGEIAIRVFRALNELGITTVSIYSKEDRYAPFRAKADESYPLNPNKGPIDAYLDIDTIIRIALQEDVDAIHPGYGFLSENPEFVDACEKNGITFIGPSSEIMRAMGDKISSKQMAIAADVPIIPGVDHAIKTADQAKEIAQMVGYPIMLKASNGGGGRGMRIVDREEDLEQEFEEAKNESKKAFGDDMIFIEKYLRGPKHVEVQVLGDNYGNVVHLFDRDCSVQRRNQKVVEYAPAFSLPDETRKTIFESAIKLCKAVNYRNAGTCEFLVDDKNNPYFIEMNPRIQVEHTVSEEITDIDIVASQILIAEGYPLNSPEVGIPNQQSIECQGFSIQTRVTTEDPANNFLPDTGTITVYRDGAGNGVRLDGGNAYQGAVISPFYDSLLVKAISHARTFDIAIRKSIRALQEMRIRGVKTNIPFLINVLNHPVFRAGKWYTTFIEETPELFDLTTGQDRATKILEFLGDKIINESKGNKPHFENRKVPVYDKTKPVYGMRDEFLKLGSEKLMQKILNDKKLYVTDTTMRDAQQSLMATRVRSKDICGAAYATNAFMQNAFSVEAWGGATFDTAYRFLKESPWDRLDILRRRMPNTLIQMLLRASNAVGYTNYPDNVVTEFINLSAKHGVDVFRIFDSLNWVENMKVPIDAALKTGKIVEGTICYTGDISSPDEKKYTLDYYVNMAKELEALGVHSLAIKDMAGLLKPGAAKTLVTALKENLHIPIHLHTHDSTGNGVSTVLMAAEAGCDIVDLAIESMSSLTSQPSMNAVVEALRGTERDTGLDFEELDELSRYYARMRKVYAPFESDMKSPNVEIYKYEIPGGQYSNLQAQVASMGSPEDFEAIKGLYKDANELLGNIVKVTPTSKAVGDLAIFMYKNNLTKENILTEGKDLSYPDSVVSYFQGMMGQPYGGFPKDLQKIVLKDLEPLTDRPGKTLPPVDLEAVKKKLIEEHPAAFENASKDTLDVAAISYALYPKVYEEYVDHFEMYNDVTKLESHVYFYGLARQEETYLNLGEGKEVLIKYIEDSEPDKDGYRNLMFMVNGSIRTIRILDKHLEIKTDRKLKADKNNPQHLGSSIPGTVGKILVKEGDKVEKNTPLMTVEAMKMETTVVSKVVGTVDKIYVQEGDSVHQDDLLISFHFLEGEDSEEDAKDA